MRVLIVVEEGAVGRQQGREQTWARQRTERCRGADVQQRAGQASNASAAGLAGLRPVCGREGAGARGADLSEAKAVHFCGSQRLVALPVASPMKKYSAPTRGPRQRVRHQTDCTRVGRLLASLRSERSEV